MNLVERLGGYERAKIIQGSREMGGLPYDLDLEDALLQYRRQHNIFKVGDWAVKTHPKNTILWPVLGVYKNGGVWLDYKGFCWKPPRVRHATDEEIKAGKRLEVKCEN